MGKIDLYAMRDEKTVLKNPHKGWYWHYIDCGYSRPRYRDDKELIGDFTAFPGLGQLYLRFDMVDINPQKGVYDFSYLDDIIDEYGKLGYSFSLRMCTYQTNVRRWGNNPIATPDYVIKEGAKGYYYDIVDPFDSSKRYEGQAWEPDYSDEIFLRYAEEAMMRLGEKYDGDPRIELVDIGTFGKYGEGHTENNIYDEAVIKRHIDIARKAFPKTLLYTNDAMLKHNKDFSKSLTEYCLSNDIGIRDDSICVTWHALNSPSYDTIHSMYLFEPFFDKIPVNIEFAHNELIREDVWKDGYTAMESLKNTKATYAGFHDYPGRFLEKNRYFAEYCANRLGYWFRPDFLELSASGGRISITNLGWAPSYRDYELTLLLTDCGGRSLSPIKIGGSSAWKEQSTTVSEFAFEKAIPAGLYSVAIALHDADGTPILMALDGKYYENGKYNIGIIEIK